MSDFELASIEDATEEDLLPGRLRQARREARAARVNAKAAVMPVMISVNELSSAYNVSRSTIYRRIDDGTLKAYRFGPRTIRFDAAEVEAAFRSAA